MITEHAQFKPYAQSEAFKSVYVPRPGDSRLVNCFSVNDQRPLVVAEREELNPDRLNQNLLLDIGGIPSYLFERDSSTAYAVVEAHEFGVLDKDCTLFRFDAHPDMERGWECTKEGLEAAYWYYSQTQTYEAHFIWDLVRRGFVTEIVWFRSPTPPGFINGNSKHLQEAFPDLKISQFWERDISSFDKCRIDRLPRRKVILNTDYDYFSLLRREYVFSATYMMRYIFQRAGLHAQALSYDYIDPEIARRLAVDFMGNVV